MVGLAAAAKRAAGVRLSVADARDHQNAGQHRRTTDPWCGPPKRPAMPEDEGWRARAPPEGPV